MTENQMKDWREICQAFANKFGYKLLFVNEESCGVETKDGQFMHVYAEEMAEFLRRN
jgi:predicted P-loop ATPase